MRKKIIILVGIAVFLSGGFFYFKNQIYYSHGSQKQIVIFEIKKGEGSRQIATNLVERNIVSNKLYLYYYIYFKNLADKIMPGTYMLSGNLSIPEIVHLITNAQAQALKVTFPEGLTARDMAEILKKNNFAGDEFLRLAQDIPESFRTRYAFLGDARVKSLEGYLFPDTYFLKKELSAENILKKMLDNFENRMDDALLGEIKKQKKELADVIILASIVEKEVPTATDMRIVAGIFENRLEIGMALQSDATLSYVLNDKTASHSYAQTKIVSPYNTYLNRGLTPGPISNPGMQSILAVVYPEQSDYTYFLTTIEGAEKKIYYAKTYAEHLVNKRKAGL